MIRAEARRERSLGLFALGLLIFSPALLSIFGQDQLVAGVPLLFLYLFAAWAGLIALMAINALGLRPTARGPSAGSRGSIPTGARGGEATSRRRDSR